MRVDLAVQISEALKLAAEHAIQEGRHTVTSDDVDRFAEVDELARDELIAVLRRAA